VDRRLAIVLDDKVRSAPNITEKINSNASITGGFTPERARDLAIVLEAGALPVPLEIVEERTVGPSLGTDSIRRGVRAALIGGIAVAIFMVVYYNACGLLAVLALILNLVILLAVLASLRGTLTLPGIAGMILTIGMAVDANVLIFERIREELGAGKTVRRAIKDGYSRAFVTILDANLTTLITAGILYQFGTGPIKGFAVTLSIGILASMFTAIVVTRTILDGITGARRLKKLSI
jgi:protein-export membrane protein SecD